MPLVLKMHIQSVFLARKHLFNSEAIYATHIFVCLHGAAAGSLGGRTEVELTTQANRLPTEAGFADKASANDKLNHDESLAHLPNRWDLIRSEIRGHL